MWPPIVVSLFGLLWLVPTNRDETKWLAIWCPPLFCFCAALLQCTSLFCIHIKINFHAFYAFLDCFILLLLVFIKWNKIICRPFFTTQKFIVNCHLVQRLLALPTHIIRYYNLKTSSERILLYKVQVKNKMRSHSWQTAFRLKCLVFKTIHVVK